MSDLDGMPGKLDIKICEPGILFISLPICQRFTLQTGNFDLFIHFHINSMILT